jgi:peptidylprolyl isomerase
MQRIWPLLLAGALVVALAPACDGGGDDDVPGAGEPDASPTIAPTPHTYSAPPEVTISADGKYFANVEVEGKGTFRIELRPDLALQTVNSFIFLAREGYYDGVTFHRVLPGFVAQAGDPTGTGSGGPGYTLPAEFSDVPYTRGTVGMARGDDVNSGGSQFFIAYADQTSLNGLYTVFGQVVEGMEVVDKITPRDPSNISTPQPATGDRIISITIDEG